MCKYTNKTPAHSHSLIIHSYSNIGNYVLLYCRLGHY